MKAVQARLQEKDADGELYTPRYICQAILGAKYEAYVDPKGKRHDSLELICRDSEHLEDFWERYQRHRARQACAPAAAANTPSEPGKLDTDKSLGSPDRSSGDIRTGSADPTTSSTPCLGAGSGCEP